MQIPSDIPLPKTPEEAIKAWRSIAKNLNVKEHEELVDVRREGDHFEVKATSTSYTSKYVLLAIGIQGQIRKLPIRGESERVLYQIPDPHKYKKKRVLVVGGGDTAIEHALLLKNAGADVVISYRRDSFFRLKDINQRNLEESGIPVIFNSNVLEIHHGAATLDVSGRKKQIPADFVAVFAGTVPPTQFLEKIGLKLENNKPVYNQNTYETSVSGLFIAGDLTKQPLIKPAILQGLQVAEEVARRLNKSTQAAR